MWHDCEDLKQFTFIKKKDTDEVKHNKLQTLNPCTCSLVDLFFRNSIKLNKREKRIAEIFQLLFSNYEFKRHMSIAYMKYSHLLVKKKVLSSI